jgi:hypothetical protein
MRDNLMKDKLLIFMCSLVLTLAATGSALAATESATGLVLAGYEPPDDKRNCPAKNRGQCKKVDGKFSKWPNECVKITCGQCKNGKKYCKKTRWTYDKDRKTCASSEYRFTKRCY